MTQLACRLSLLAALLCAGPARAEDTSDLEGLLDESVVSTASRSAEAANVAPATTSVIGADELRRYGIRSLDEAIDFLSLGMVTEHSLSTAEAGARGVLLTGDNGTHVLLLIDGHAQNEEWDGTAYLDRGQGIPWELVDHLEVILGPGSVLYGSHAMFGVINVVTKRAKDYAGEHLILESEVPNSLRGGAGIGQEFTLFGLKSELVAQLEDYGSQGPGFTLGPQPYGNDAVTGLPKNFGNADGVWGGTLTRGLYAQIPAAYARWTLGSFELAGRASLFKRASPGWGTFNDPQNFETDRWVSLDARWSARLSSIANLSLRAYGDYYDYLQNAPSDAPEDCLEGQDQGCVYRLRGVARWGGLEAISNIDWLRNGRLVTLVGMDGRVRSFSSDETYLDAATGAAPPGNSYAHVEGALGAYLQQTGKPFSWLDLNLGARLDADQRFGTHLSPRAAAVATLWEGGAIKAIYSEAFRAPTAYERYYADPLGSIAAPNLRPETVRSVEGSIEQRLGPHRLLVSVFSSWWSDLIFLDEATPDEIAAAQQRGEISPDVSSAVYTYRNASSVQNWGANLAYEARLWRRLRLGLNLTLARTRQVELAGEAAVTPAAAAQVFGNARLSYDFGGEWPTVALAARVVGPRTVADTGADSPPQLAAQAELRLSLTGAFPWVPGLSYRLSGDYYSATSAPYAIGPVTTPVELSPLPRYRVLMGLQLDLQ